MPSQNVKLIFQSHAVLNIEYYFLLSHSWCQLVNNFIEAMLSYLKMGLIGLFRQYASLKLVYTIWMYQLKFESYMVANKHSVSTYAGGHNLFTGVKMEWSSDRDAEPVHHEIQFKRNIDYRSWRQETKVPFKQGCFIMRCQV